MYDFGSLRFSLDLHDPGNEAGVPEFDPNQIEFALVADVGYFALAPGSIFPNELGFEDLARRRAVHGARLVHAQDRSSAMAPGSIGWTAHEIIRGCRRIGLLDVLIPEKVS